MSYSLVCAKYTVHYYMVHNLGVMYPSKKCFHSKKCNSAAQTFKNRPYYVSNNN